MNIKKIFYITSFTFLGVLLGFLVHAWVEIFVIDLLTSDFKKYGLGFSMEAWFFIHKIWSFATLAGGAAFGLWQGKRWFKVIYEEKKT